MKPPPKSTLLDGLAEAVVVAVVGVFALKATPIILLMLMFAGLASCVM